jgi:hypothetical protein
MRSLLRLTALLTALAVSACASASSPARIAVLRHPETRQTVECRVDPWGHLDRALQVENCIKVYKKAGYELVADSAD